MFRSYTEHIMESQLDLFDRRTSERITTSNGTVICSQKNLVPSGRSSRSTGVQAALERIRDEGAVIGRSGLGWRFSNDVDAFGRRIPVIDPDQLDTLHRIHELRAEGCSLRAIAEMLSGEGRVTARGGRWHASTVRSILRPGRNAAFHHGG